MATAPTGLPFDDIRRLVAMLPGPDEAARAALRRRREQAGEAADGLGRLTEIVDWLAAWQGRPVPAVEQPLVALFAASQTVAARVMGCDPADVGRRRVDAVSGGTAAVNRICAALDVSLRVFDLAVMVPTPDIAIAEAMDERGCAATMAFGMEAAATGADLLCIGTLGPGHATAAAAICRALWGGRAEDWIAPEPGCDGTGPARMAAAVAETLRFHDGRLGDPLEVLRRLGGRAISAVAGAIVATRHERIPVLLAGPAAAAAAAVLAELAPGAIDHCRAAQAAAGSAEAAMFARLGLAPLVDLGLGGEEGAGGALAVPLIRAAAATPPDVPSVAEAGAA